MIDSNYKFTHDGSPEYARKSLQLSLSHLGVDYIDLYILRSKDPKVPIEESVKAMAVNTSSELLVWHSSTHTRIHEMPCTTR